MMTRLQRRCLVWSSLVLLWCLTAVSPLLAQQPVPLADYWQQLETLRERVAAGETLAVAAVLEQLTAVSLPNGRLTTVDHQFLIAEIKQDDVDNERLLSLFDALLATRPLLIEQPHAELDQDVLDSVLQRPEFQYEEREPTTLERWWQDIQERFWAFVSRLFPDADTPLGQFAMRVGTFGGATLLLLVIGLALRNLLSGLVAEANLQMEEAEAELLTADSAFARAQELSAGGDFRTAVRYLYLSALLLLEEQGLLRYDRSRTNREYLRSVAHKPELARILREVVEVFDSVWYGYHPLDQAEYDAYVRRVEALKQQR